MHFTITTSPGLESLVKSECERLQFEHIKTTDQSVRCEGNIDDMYRLNIHLRTANRVYIELSKGQVEDFDTLFSMVSKINWREYLPKNHPIIVNATSVRSILTHTPSIQKIGKKALVETLLQNTHNSILTEDEALPQIHILILIVDNIASILLDTSGEALHKRGYRKEQGEAPLKETLAAAIVMLTRWKYSEPFYDPFCGSGTIAIEAAMIARNIAPGLFRNFACEYFPFHEEETMEKIRDEAEKKIFPSGKYQIIASDKDEQVLEFAERNARRAGVISDITFRRQDFFELANKMPEQTDGITLVSNPPYGLRLNQDDIGEIHEMLAKVLQFPHMHGGIITAYENFGDMAPKTIFKERKLYNGSELCRFWHKK